MKAFLQDRDGTDIVTIEITGPSPDIIQYKGDVSQYKNVYFRRHRMRKHGDCLYRPASIAYVH